MNKRLIVVATATAVAMGTPACATLIPSGTLTAAALFAPTVSLGTTKTFKAANGVTAEIAGSGGFSGAAGVYPTMLGTMNGKITFSSTVDTTLAEILTNFFVFNDGDGGQYKFSASSVKTMSYLSTASSKSIALYLLGTTIDTHLGYSATPTAMTLSFNKTGNSFYSAATTLAVASVPEPASWAMMVGGFGLIGAALRNRRKTAVSFG